MLTLNTPHTWLALGLAAVMSLPAEGQLFSKNPFRRFSDDGHWGFGLVDGSLNYPETITGGFDIAFYTNLHTWNNSSLSIGTNLRFGAENGKGWGAPDVIGVVVYSLVLGAAGVDASSANLNTPTLGWYSEVPLQLEYNYGLGSNQNSDKRWGFFVGGGLNFVATDFTDNQNHPQATSFVGYCFTAGIRLSKHLEISLTQVNTFTPTLGPITRSPAQYDFTISYFDFFRH